MNVKYKEGKIQFDLHDLLQYVDKETKLEMIESLSCDDTIIKHVTEQIINKWTENCYSGGSNCTASSEVHLGLDWAWREVAKRSGDVAKREIERLEEAIRYKDERYLELLQENRELRSYGRAQPFHS
jgi:hypothetical protein